MVGRIQIKGSKWVRKVVVGGWVGEGVGEGR